MAWTQKTVGRREVGWRTSPEAAAAWQDEVARWNPERALCDKGVFRFRSFEEADRWMAEQLARKARERRRRPTSPGSREA